MRTERTLTVFEHQRLRLGQEFETPRGPVTLDPRSFEKLSAFAEHTGALRLGHRSVITTQYVGTVDLGRLRLEILPKVGKRGEAASWRALLTHMVLHAANVPSHWAPDTALRVRRMDLLQVLTVRFLDATAQVVRDGLVHDYHEVEETLTVYRGRLMAASQLRDNLAHRERFAVAYEAWDTWHPVNRVLAAALDRVLAEHSHPELTLRAAELRAAFPPALPTRSLRPLLSRLRLDRRTRRYKVALQLARLLLLREGPTADRGEKPIPALLFDMNQLFERYIARVLRGIPGLKVKSQSQRTFWRSPAGNRVLKPDLLVWREGESAPLVIDTKWKRLDDGRPSDTDLRQIFAYLHLFGGRRGVLLYPDEAGGHPGALGHYEVGTQSCETARVPLLFEGRPDRRAVTQDLLKLWRMDVLNGSAPTA